MGFFWKKSRESSGGEVSYRRLSSLNSIRVVKFKSGTSKHPIRVKLKTININTTRYTALSYTWDSDDHGRQTSQDSTDAAYGQSAAEAMHTIICNRTVVHVNKNLWDALNQLRDLKSEVPIFIDRLCINFDSREERAAQSNMMGHIYGKAAAVIIWMGKKTAFSSDTVLIMRKLVNALDWRKLPPGFRCDFRDPMVYRELGLERISLAQWSHVFALCERKWFTRTWTFYELANAKEATFLYGDCWMDYNFVMDFAMVLKLTGWLDGTSDLYMGAGGSRNASNSSLSKQHANQNDSNRGSTRSLEQLQLQQLWTEQESVALTTMLASVAIIRATPTWHPQHIEYERVMRMEYNLRTEAQRAWKFLELLLQHSEGFECSDPRDRILAPLAYARRALHGTAVNREWPIVDYGTSVETMYTHFAQLIQQHTGQQSILATASTMSPATASRPAAVGTVNRVPKSRPEVLQPQHVRPKGKLRRIPLD